MPTIQEQLDACKTAEGERTLDLFIDKDATTSQISHHEFSCVLSALTHDDYSITTLNFSYYYVDRQLNAEYIARLLDTLAKPNCSVRNFHVWKIGPENLGPITNHLSNGLSQLLSLTLSNSNLLKAGICDFIAFTEALKQPNCSLTRLYLANIHEGHEYSHYLPKAISALVDVIRHPASKLTLLDLSRNQIKRDGLFDIIASLNHRHSTLSTLYLKEVRLESAHLLAIADVIKDPMCKASFINLAGNFFLEKTLSIVAHANFQRIMNAYQPVAFELNSTSGTILNFQNKIYQASFEKLVSQAKKLRLLKLCQGRLFQTSNTYLDCNSLMHVVSFLFPTEPVSKGCSPTVNRIALGIFKPRSPTPIQPEASMHEADASCTL